MGEGGVLHAFACALVREVGRDEKDAVRAGPVALDGHSLHRA